MTSEWQVVKWARIQEKGKNGDVNFFIYLTEELILTTFSVVGALLGLRNIAMTKMDKWS